MAVHGRTREQYYSGSADWDIIRQVKEAVKIPVIGNGDVDSPQKAKRLLEETGCDGVMIARAAQGNPWIFRDTVHYLQTGELLPPPTNAEKREIVLRRLQGETLDAVAQSFDLTRERVRQIVNKTHQKIQTWTALQTGMPRFDEDYFLYFYETYELDRQDAEQWFGLTTPVLRYLDLLAKVHRRRPLQEATKSSLTIRSTPELDTRRLSWLPKYSTTFR